MRHEFKDQPQERFAYTDRWEAKMRDKERGAARKAKNAIQFEGHAKSKSEREDQYGSR
jgi:hypothetical protein